MEYTYIGDQLVLLQMLYNEYVGIINYAKRIDDAFQGRSAYTYCAGTISRHTVVCRAAQEAGTPHREYIDRKNENVIFTPLYLGDHLSDWNQICYTVSRQPRESTFQI